MGAQVLLGSPPTQLSDWEPVGHLNTSLFQLGLLRLCNWEFVSRVCLRDQVVLASQLLHDAGQGLLLTNIELDAEVLRHQVVLPSTELGRAELYQVFLCQLLRVALPLV